MKILFIINDPPYGTERCFNAMRLALALQKEEEKPEITLFLMADAVICAKAGQKTPDGYYSLEQMIKASTATPKSYYAAPAWTHAALRKAN